jgi:EmrB/QacA subfamily drug resistance transporter
MFGLTARRVQPRPGIADPSVVDPSVVDPSVVDAGVIAPSIPPTAPGGNEPLPRRGLVFFIVSVGLFMVSVDQTIVATALSTIQHELHTGIQWSSWTISIYTLGQVLVMPLAGKLSDALGRKQVFLAGIAIFTVSSLLCGLSTNIYMLVALRLVQAIGGGTLMPSATGIVGDHFGRNRDRAIGMFTSIFPIGGIIGPILGGIFVTFGSWRDIFLVNVPIGAVVIVLAVILLPKGAPRARGKIDAVGVALVGTLLLGAMFGISLLGSGRSVWSPDFLVPEGIAVVALVLFVRHSRNSSAPFIPMRLLHGRGFGVMNLINFFYGAAALGFGALVPLYAEDRFGVPVLQAGTLLTARAIGMICIAGIAVLTLRRTGYRLPMIVGFAIIAAGLLGMALAPENVPPYLWLSIAGGVTGIGMGLSVPASNNATMQLAPDQLAGIAGLRGMFRQSGAIMGVSITTAIVAGSGDPGGALAVVFSVFAGLLVLVLPLVFLVPEHHGRW